MRIWCVGALCLAACTVRDHYSYPPDADADGGDGDASTDADPALTCTSDSDCVSMACLLEGVCADPSSVMQVAPATGVDQGDCVADPCATLVYAVGRRDSGRNVIKIVGAGPFALLDLVTIDGGGRLTILSSNSRLYGTSIRIRSDAQVDLLGTTIEYDGTGTTSAITLEAVGAPILNVDRSAFFDLGGFAIQAPGGTLSVTRSVFKSNGGGISRVGSAGPTTIVNNLFIENVAFPGAAITLDTTASTLVQFNTVSNNTAIGAGAIVSCTSGFVRNNIIYGNGGTPTSGCGLEYNIVGPAGSPPVTNLNADPMLVTAGDAYSLSPASPARGFADPTTPLSGVLAIDHEGETRPRPIGDQADVGWDEVD